MSAVTSPFKFLDSYQREDVDIFFGRERETENLYDALSGVKHLLVYGPSGSGKTSLIECGLRNQFSDAAWYALSIRRGAHLSVSVFARINEALRRKIPLDPQTKLPTDPDLDFGHAVEQLFDERYKPVYLLFDQFEELLISGEAAEKRDFFIRLDRLIRYKVPCRVLLVMREEFIGHLSEFEHLCPSIFQHRFRLEKMGRAGVREVIEKILAAPQYLDSFTAPNPNTLADKILSKLPDQQREIELTHVQVFLSELWDRAQAEQKSAQPQLHEGLVHEEDHLEGVLNSFLRNQLRELDSTYGQNTTLELLAAMISERHTKLQVGEATLTAALEKNNIALNPPLSELLRDLERRRILRTLKSGEQPQYEISHDVLARVVGQNLTEEMKLRERAREVYRVYEGRTGLFSREDLDYLRGFEGFLALPEGLKGRMGESENEINRREREELEKAQEQVELERQRAEEAMRLQKKAESEQKKAQKMMFLAISLAVMALVATIAVLFQQTELKKQKREVELSQNKTLVALDSLKNTELALKAANKKADSSSISSLVASYNRLVTEGKSSMEASEYEVAITYFTSALSLIHDRPKIINDQGQSTYHTLNLCRQMLAKSITFNLAIRNGDDFMDKGLVYVLEAINEYKKAYDMGYNNSLAESRLVKADGEKKAAFLVLKDKGIAFVKAGKCEYARYFLQKARLIFQDAEIDLLIKKCEGYEGF